VLTITPDVYVPMLTGREPNRAGKIRCPLHAGGREHTPSFHVYPDAERGWTCFGCSRGGTIVDLAGLLYAIAPRGRGYHEILERLEHELGTARAGA
jgi:hypothetical protein